MSNRLIASLPAHAKKIIRRIESMDRARQGRIAARREEVRDLMQRQRIVGGHLGEMVAADQRGQLTKAIRETKHDEIGNPVTRDVVVRDIDRLSATESELAEIDAHLAKIAAEVEPPAMNAQRLYWLIDQLPQGVRFKPHQVSVNFTGRKSLKSAWKVIEGLSAEREAVLRAPRPIEEVRERVRAQVAALAGRGLPLVGDCFRGADAQLPSVVIGRNGDDVKTILDGAALVAWLFQSELERRLDECLLANKPDDAMSAEAQTAAIQEIDAKLLTAWRNYCAFVEVAESHYPPNAPVEAVLQVDIVR